MIYCNIVIYVYCKLLLHLLKVTENSIKKPNKSIIIRSLFNRSYEKSSLDGTVNNNLIMKVQN